MLNSNELYWTSVMLEHYKNELGNHGSNDFQIPNTSKNRKLAEKIIEFLNKGDPEDSPSSVHVSEDGLSIYLMDWMLVRYLQHKLSDDAVKTAYLESVWEKQQKRQQRIVEDHE